MPKTSIKTIAAPTTAERRSQALAKAFEDINAGNYFPLLMAHVSKAMHTQTIYPFVIDNTYSPKKDELADEAFYSALLLDLLAKAYAANQIC